MTTVTRTRFFTGSGSVDSTPLIAGKQFVGRRAVLIGLVTALLPSPTHAQKAPMPPRIGWLSAGSEPDPFLDGFREGLRKLGYVEGQNVVLEIRHAHGDLEAPRAGAAELAQANVILIVASLTAVRAARAIKDIPIVFVISGDPIEAGLAKRDPAIAPAAGGQGDRVTGRLPNSSLVRLRADAREAVEPI